MFIIFPFRFQKHDKICQIRIHFDWLAILKFIFLFLSLKFIEKKKTRNTWNYIFNSKVKRSIWCCCHNIRKESSKDIDLWQENTCFFLCDRKACLDMVLDMIRHCWFWHKIIVILILLNHTCLTQIFVKFMTQTCECLWKGIKP